MKFEIDFSSSRSKEAHLAARIGKSGYRIMKVLTVILAAVGIACLVVGQSRLGYLVSSVALIDLMFVLWYRNDLADIPPLNNPSRLDDILAPSLLARLRSPMTPRGVWQALDREIPARFLCNHLLLAIDSITEGLSQNDKDMDMVWQKAMELHTQSGARVLDGGTLAAALILTSQSAPGYLAQLKLANEDVIEVYNWLERILIYLGAPKPYFGGFGRDWASGFTPTLDRFGENISRSVEMTGSFAHYLSHADSLDAVIHNLSNGAGVAIVGEAGVGKTESTRALAERLLEGHEPSLEYYQIISLSASQILSANASSLERLMLTLFGEAVRAGNIILFLDEAELFFGKGTGAVDLSQLILPIIQNHRLKVIAAFTPNDWQHLKSTNSALAANFVVVNMIEPGNADTMKILEDNAVILEGQNGILLSYRAIVEAYKLSGQYMQELAYPGKALNLLEQAVSYANDKVVTAESIQSAIEKTLGVKVSAASAPEAQTLLKLEDRIHERMINQTRAVGVIAGALRRGRAGVSNPKRPVGSFLFLGPTGVGKTELARSLAAVYFGSEQQMIRLDMTEYQQAEDVSRLLSTGEGANKSLLMSIREQPFSVVLLDEIEKAHPNILNLMLQLLDEGQLTDASGRPALFRNAIIIATSNAGATEIAARLKAGDTFDSFERPLIDKLIADGSFKPELINRFDEIVLFRPLQPNELGQVARLMLGEVNKTLSAQKVSVELTPAALEKIVQDGYDPEFGARPMRRVIQKTVEDAVAIKLLGGEAKPGSTITLDVSDLATDKSDVNKVKV